MNNKFALHGSIQHARTRGSSHTHRQQKACILWCSTITPEVFPTTHIHIVAGRGTHEIEPPPSRHAPSPDPALRRELPWWLRRLRRSATLPTCAESVWQGAKFLSHCPGSAHAEYEGLVPGLEAAAASGFTSFSLDIEGDCRVVLSQAAGRSRSRKLSKLHSRAKACLEQMPLNGRPSYGSIPR